MCDDVLFKGTKNRMGSLTSTVTVPEEMVISGCGLVNFGT